MKNEYPSREHILGIINILKELNPKLFRNIGEYPISNEIWLSAYSKQGQIELGELLQSMGLTPFGLDHWDTSMSIYYGDPNGPSIKIEPTADS